MNQLRLAVRQLRKSPAFSLTVICTLALGIGVNTAIFSVVDAVMLRPLPYPHPEQLVSVGESERGETGQAMAPANLRDYGQNHVFTGIAHVGTPGLTLTGGGQPERLTGVATTYNFFDVIGIHPALGRGFSAEEDRYGARPVVVLSDELWRRRFGADAGVVGSAVRLDEKAYTVVGVMPPHFQAPLEYSTMQPVSFYVPSAFPPEVLSNRGEHWDHAFARLRPGVSLAAARAEMDAVAARLAKAYPRTNGKTVIVIEPLRARQASKVRTPLLVLLGAVGLLLLIACANVGNLLLARGATQTREVAIRAALGAGRGRIVGGLLAQAAVLAAAGCAAGLTAAWWLDKALVAMAPADIPRLQLAATLDPAVLGYSAALGVVTVLLCGLFPAWLTAGAAPQQILLGMRQQLAGRAPRRWRSTLSTAEIALALVLLIGSGLLLKSFLRVSHVELGFSPDRVVAVDLNLPEIKYTDAKRRLAFFQELERRVSALPGVASVAYGRLPLRGHWSSSFETAEHPIAGDGEHGPEADFQMVSAGYFQTLGVSLLAGRPFTAADRDGAEPVLIVNQTLAERCFPHGSALGHRIRRLGTPVWRTIVGITAPVHLFGQAAEVDAQVYLPAAQTDSYPMAIAGFAVRSRQDAAQLIRAVQREVWAIDPDQPLTRLATYRGMVSDSLAQRRFQTTLLLLFAALALTLALVGIVGVISYSVEQRTAEIGLRVAIGAQRRDILALVGREGLLLAGVGVACGLSGAFFATRLLRSLLFRVEPFDLATYGLLAMLTLGAALAASYLPARRAAGIDPMTAMRET